jgi:NADH dehydrogenase
VVVVGAGVGGLEAVKALATCDVRVVVVDKKNHHRFRLLLYQVATASLSPADVAWPIRSILANQKKRDGGDGRGNRSGSASKDVKMSDGHHFDYDYLIATGATHSHFSHPEWARIAPGTQEC